MLFPIEAFTEGIWVGLGPNKNVSSFELLHAGSDFISI
jgi:hypothetical protein